MDNSDKRHKSQKAQIMGGLHQMAGGVPAAAPCRAHGMSSATLSTWGGEVWRHGCQLHRRGKAIAGENRRLTRMLQMSACRMTF